MEISFLANVIEQIDFALDHVALQDVNYKRLALMLIDNALELTVHKHAQEIKRQAWFGPKRSPEFEKALQEALGQRFEAKVKFARVSKLVSDEVAQSINTLHSYRNQVYHQGVMHGGILHALAMFYLQIACDVLAKFPEGAYSWSSKQKIPHRAIKYIGQPPFHDPRTLFPKVWARLKEVASGIDFTLVSDLHAELAAMIDRTDDLIDYLRDGHPVDARPSRDEAVLDVQSWHIAFSEEGRRFAADRGVIPERPSFDFVPWIKENYSFTHRKDPVPAWRERLAAFETEANEHLALKKYQDFVSQTASLREIIEASADALDEEINRQIDDSRGKWILNAPNRE